MTARCGTGIIYAPPWQDKNACSFEEARRRVTDPEHPWYGQHLGRAGTRKAFNALVQGLGARHTKLWMRAVFQQTGVIPLVQMHDALECSVTSREQAETIARLGEEAVSLNVPMKVDLKFGRTWGEAHVASPSWEELTGEPAPASKPAPKPARGNSTQAGDRHPTEAGDLHPVAAARDPNRVPRTPTADAAAASPRRRSTTPRSISPTWSTSRCRADRMILCPFHGETKPSMRIYPDHYYCFGCGACGDHVDWLVQVEGLEYGQARDIVDNWDGPVVPRSQRAGRRGGRPAHRLRTDMVGRRQADPGHAGGALSRARSAASISTLCRTISASEALRFHPTCVFGPGTRHPCLLALMRNPISGAPTGIQRIALTPDAQKIDRMMLGPAGVVQLWPAVTASW